MGNWAVCEGGAQSPASGCVLSPQRGLEARVDNKLHHLRSAVSISSEFSSIFADTLSCGSDFNRLHH